jgi:hypothetical protein
VAITLYIMLAESGFDFHSGLFCSLVSFMRPTRSRSPGLTPVTPLDLKHVFPSLPSTLSVLHVFQYSLPVGGQWLIARRGGWLWQEIAKLAMCHVTSKALVPFRISG